MKLLGQSGVALFIDSAFRIAHSKVIIVDKSMVITGSFNFTKSAETSNSENLLVISHAPDLAHQYTVVWNKHHALSTPYTNYSKKSDHSSVRSFRVWRGQF